MKLTQIWSDYVCRQPWLILLVTVIITALSIVSIGNLKVSTKLEALMPEAAASVRTLNTALKKTGSFASIQIVVSSDNPAITLQFIQDVQKTIDPLDWVSSSQYSEDISVIDQHKLLLLEPAKLLEIEAEVKENYPTLLAQQLEQRIGIPLTIELREQNVKGSSDNVIDSEIIEGLSKNLDKEVETNRLFQSEDKKAAILVVWPKPGLDSLSDAKKMVDQSEEAINAIKPSSYGDNLRAGVAGRIKNKVAQYNAVVGDLKIGLITSISLIVLLLSVAFRSVAAIPLIIIPLILGIVWTIGLTAVTVGGLNLITIFLALILFGLGIDFGIHNFNRFRETRVSGASLEDSIHVIINQTGVASLTAALTTALGFYSLMLTDFRAFAEFGFIAGSGILLVFVTMYSVFPALVVIFERVFKWRVKAAAAAPGNQSKPLLLIPYKCSFVGALILLVISLLYISDVGFEKNFKNLEAQKNPDHLWATLETKRVFPDGHDRAIIVAETQEELVGLQAYFQDKIENDLETPTIHKVTSILDFLPLLEDQEERLEIIKRLQVRAEDIKAVDEKKYDTVAHYLNIGNLFVTELPTALQRTFLGTESEPGFLMYVYNSVTMDDSDLAKQFYDDAAGFEIGGKSYSAASEGFIFVEMIALMKADAIKAVLLVTLTTIILVYIFVREFKGTVIILIPPILGVVITLGFMGAFGPTLSIMNMVVLPSLIGISVDNCIHIFHRFKEGKDPDIEYIMSTTGHSAVLTTLTTLIGFGGMVTASMGGLRTMGLLAIIGFIACLIMTWFVLPALLEFYKKSKKSA